MSSRPLSVLLGALLVVSISREQPARRPVDVILVNGHVITVDPHFSIAEAIAITGGTIAAVDKSAIISKLADPATKIIDLHGQTVVPGLADGHLHDAGGGPGVDLSRARSLKDVLAAVAERVHRSHPGEIIVSNRLRAYLDRGFVVAGGTDSSPVVPYPPLWVMYHFVSRDTISGGVLGAGQRITREEALRILTINNAYLTFEETLKGSIEPGKLADLVVLPEDILTCPVKHIDQMKVSMTIVGGRVAYTR